MLSEDIPGSIIGHSPERYRIPVEKSESYQDNTGTSRITLGVVKSSIRTIRMIFPHYETMQGYNFI